MPHNLWVSLILLNKPFHVLSQFTDSAGRKTLADYVLDHNVYPAGRLDFDSEGLLALTSDGRLQAAISHPAAKLAKSYWVQVEGEATRSQLDQLLAGVPLKDGPACARQVELIGEPPRLWARDPPIRERRSVPTSWLSLTIDEGRNRQVRRMTAAVGLPALRLIRYAVGPWKLDGLMPGESRRLQSDRAWRSLRG